MITTTSAVGPRHRQSRSLGRRALTSTSRGRRPGLHASRRHPASSGTGCGGSERRSVRTAQRDRRRPRRPTTARSGTSRRRRSTPRRTCRPGATAPQPLPVPANSGRRRPARRVRAGRAGGRTAAAVGHLRGRLDDRRPGHRRGARRQGPARPLPAGQHAQAADRAAAAEEPDEPGSDRRGHRERRRSGRHPGRHRGRRQVHGPATADVPDHHLGQRRRERAGQGQRRLRQDHRRHERDRARRWARWTPGRRPCPAWTDLGSRRRPTTWRCSPRRTWRPRRSRRSSPASTSGCPPPRARATSRPTTTSCSTSTRARSAARPDSPTTPATPTSAWPGGTADGSS